MVTAKTKKTFYVIAYDITNDKRRAKVMKALCAIGARANYSVFEAMLTKSQLSKLIKEISVLIDISEDSVVYYSICRKCYSNIIYQMRKRPKPDDSIVVV
jgi:CRISPR-associated protein Cas2